METQRSSKKTRSYGGPPENSRSIPSAIGSSSEHRPHDRERVKSAPLGLSYADKQQQQSHSQPSAIEGHRRESHTSKGKNANLSPSRSSQHTQASSSQSNRPNGSGQVSTPQKSRPHLQGTDHQLKDGSIVQIPEITLAVLGAPAAGKTTFVRCALDLKKTPTSPISSKKVSLEGKISLVRLIELRLDEVQVMEEERVRWPEKVGDQNTPDIDGALAVYDVTDQSSIAALPKLLKALSKRAMPTILVSTNCDHPTESWEIDQDLVHDFCTRLNGLETFQTSAAAPETHKRCISVLLRNVMSDQRSQGEEQDDEEEEEDEGEEEKEEETANPPQMDRTPRPRALTSIQPIKDSSATYPLRTKSNHGRAASEISISSSGKGTIGQSILAQSKVAKALISQRIDAEGSKIGAEDLGQASGFRNPLHDIHEVPTRQYERHALHHHTDKEPDAEDPNSDITDKTIDAALYDEEEQNLPLPKEESSESVESFSTDREDEQSQDPGISFEALVDRLLSEPRSKVDTKFTTIFLCLYRKFAAPSNLIIAIIRRFEDLNDKDIPYMTRMRSQLRHLNILKAWVSDYPGDFAHPLSRRIVTGFVQSLTTSHDFAVASSDIGPQLEIVTEDDDTEWACSDTSRSRANTMESFLTMSSGQSVNSTLNADSPTLTADSSTEDVMNNNNSEKTATSKSNRVSATPSSTSSITRSDSQSNGSFLTLLNTVESTQRQAQLLTPVSRHMLTKVQWRQLMEIPEDQIARELTRIDWILYSSIKARDLIRHVSLQDDQKEKCRSLEHVNRMIHQFNHIAFWVTNMILLRDKPKHRAKALEKFMCVAWKLRQLNNYNSLGAVIAGINGTAVHRLSQTRELVPPEARKQFMRLEILMGTQKSHSAYRLAFGNTSTSRIPFLPLHRRDLVLAEQANKTFVDTEENGRINWKKFEVMGEVIVAIRRSQDTGYPTITRNEEVQRLVLEGRFCKDDDVLYERSVQIEAPGVGENTRKRFNWFQR